MRDLLAPSVVKANPFMRAMSAADLLVKCEHDLSEDRPMVIAVPRRDPSLAQPAFSLRQLIEEEKRQLDCAMRGCRKLSALPRPLFKGRKS